MNKYANLFRTGLPLFLLSVLAFCVQAETLDDAAVRRAIIMESISNYAGNCPCPYSRTRRGRRCGGRSAYSRPGGASPICYPGDVSAVMIERYRYHQKRR